MCLTNIGLKNVSCSVLYICFSRLSSLLILSPLSIITGAYLFDEDAAMQSFVVHASDIADLGYRLDLAHEALIVSSNNKDQALAYLANARS